jgi:hypothetical protein
MAHYTEIDSSAFEEFLSSQGFERGVANNEVVYSMRYLDTCLHIKIYTTISVNAAVARDCNLDAIRCVVVGIDKINGRTWGVGRFPKVLRTTSQASVHERVSNRIDAAIIRCKEWCEEQKNKRATINQERANTTPAPDSRPVPESASNVNDASAMGSHFGSLGEQKRLTVRVIGRKEHNGKFLFTMKDTYLHTIIYWSLRDVLQVGETYNIGCKITGYNSFGGVKQTIVSEVVGKRIVL